jgi:hypothetical protein
MSFHHEPDAHGAPFPDEQMNEMLRVTLSVSVPMRILDCYLNGGPTAAQCEEARMFVRRALAPEGVRRLFSSQREGEIAAAVNALAQALAALSFLPHGVPPLFGASRGFHAHLILAGFVNEALAQEYCRQVTHRYHAAYPPVWGMCFLLGEEQTPHAFAVTDLLTTLSEQDLRDLRHERYTNHDTGADGRPRVRLECVTSRLLMLASADASILLLMKEAVRRGETLPLCRLDAQQVEAWISAHRPDLAQEEGGWQ